MTSPCPTSNRAPLRSALLGLAAVSALSGCASYTERTSGALSAFRSGQFDAAVGRFEDTEVTGSVFLSQAEAGMVSLVAGDWSAARKYLGEAARLSDEFADAGPLDPESVVEALGSLVLNDSQRDYEGEGFERVYAHATLGLAYLAEGLVDDLLVEVRRADKLLTREEQLYEADYRAGGLGHFLSAVAYGLKGEPDQALLDYRRMVDKGVGLELAGPELSLLATRLRRDGEFAQHLEQYPPAPWPGGLEEGEAPAEVVVIGGAGLAPFKVEQRLDFFTPNGVVSLTTPAYMDRGGGEGGFILSALESSADVRTAVIERVGEVARANLQDRLGAIALRTGLRNVARFALRNGIEEEHGTGAALAFDLVGVLLERADVRSWLTLPNTWHAARLRLPAGVHTLELSSLSGGFSPLGTYDLEPGETLIVLARSFDQRLFAHVLGGRRSDTPTAADPAPTTPDPQLP